MIIFEIHFDSKETSKALTEGVPIGKQKNSAIAAEIDNLARHLLGFSAQSASKTGFFQSLKNKILNTRSKRA